MKSTKLGEINGDGVSNDLKKLPLDGHGPFTNAGQLNVGELFWCFNRDLGSK
jgi:hypothetical protein